MLGVYEPIGLRVRGCSDTIFTANCSGGGPNLPGGPDCCFERLGEAGMKVNCDSNDECISNGSTTGTIGIAGLGERPLVGVEGHDDSNSGVRGWSATGGGAGGRCARTTVVSGVTRPMASGVVESTCQVTGPAGALTVTCKPARTSWPRVAIASSSLRAMPSTSVVGATTICARAKLAASTRCTLTHSLGASLHSEATEPHRITLGSLSLPSLVP
eukprot:TRINITY_DN6951_c0_g1_i1.p2 TRINITY_DN6951_c0_g1~~TRINITY_DN6951_c0_g1_i1.p2  ORF type:complete len:215 (-),score=10.74 TRINITY_DN6951_c0_g1_i1:201-845(-)